MTVTLAPLAARAAPPVPGLRARYHAILRARFAPGDGLQRAGAALALLALGGAAARKVRPARRFAL